MNEAGQREQNSRIHSKARNLAVIKNYKEGHGEFFFPTKSEDQVKAWVKKSQFFRERKWKGAQSGR